jgi:hypothetical protein
MNNDLSHLNQNNQTVESIDEIINHLHQIRDLCRNREWYASATYASLAAETLFHMNYMGDKAQRPDMMIMLTDVHHSAYPITPEPGCECD